MVRIKHRYLLVNILYPIDDKPAPSSKEGEELPWTVQFRRPSSERLDGRILMRLIRDGVSDLFGDYGAGMVAGSLQVKYLSTATSTAIIRVARAHYRMVWAALSFATRLPKPVDQACVIQVVRVSGTIKKAEEEAIRRARAVIVRAQRARPGASADTAINGTRMDGDGDLHMLDGIEDKDDGSDGEQDDDDDDD